MTVYQCEDTLEGVFTAIYNAYEEQRDHRDTRISLNGEAYLFAEYIRVESQEEKAAKVIRTLKRRFGTEDYEKICFALSSGEEDKAQAVYQTIVKGLERDAGPGHLFDNLADDDCRRAYYLSRSASRENRHLYGFLRFEEIQGKILYARIGPKNRLMPFLMSHFAERFPMENFVIHDERRSIFGVHPAGGAWFLVQDGGLAAKEHALRMSGAEAEIQELFAHFCRSIAIRERENLSLQQNMLPLRFREYMCEFDSGEKSSQNGK